MRNACVFLAAMKAHGAVVFLLSTTLLGLSRAADDQVPQVSPFAMCVTDGGNTVSRMNTYLLEAERLDGDWRIITYMKDFGVQGYFVNIPSKFIGADGKTMWLLYSGNFSLDENQKPHPVNPPGGHYGLTFQKIELK